jgi:hypothetical protein
VRLVDDRAVDLGRHLWRGAEVVVDADLDDVHFLGGNVRDLLPRVVWCLGIEHRPGDEHPRPIERGGILLGPRREH